MGYVWDICGIYGMVEPSTCREFQWNLMGIEGDMIYITNLTGYLGLAENGVCALHMTILMGIMRIIHLGKFSSRPHCSPEPWESWFISGELSPNGPTIEDSEILWPLPRSIGIIGSGGTIFSDKAIWESSGNPHHKLCRDVFD